MARKYGFGVIGLGIGFAHCERIVKESRAKLVAVCDTDATKCERAAEKFGVNWFDDYDAMLAEPAVDGVVVATPTGMHAEHAIAAAKAGKHVLCEKPLDIDLARARRIVDACRKAGVKLQVGFQNRFTAASRRTQHDIRTGRIGKPLFAEMLMHWWRGRPGYFVRGGWRGTWKYDGGGAFMNQAIHWIDLLIWLLGEPVSVVGRTKTMLFPIETEDVGMAIVTFEGGVQASLIATTTATTDENTRIYVQGDKGHVTLDGVYVLERGDVKLAPPKKNAPRAPRASSLYRDLAQAIDGDREPICTGQDSLKALAVIKAIYKSSRTGREVKL